MFVGRKQELDALSGEFNKNAPSLVVVRGRRRVGKSHLLRESVKNRKHIYFQATRISDALNLEAFKEAVSVQLGSSPVLDGINSWEAILYYLASFKDSHPKLVMIIDEFPYLVDQAPALPSMMQRFWDAEPNQNGNLKLVLCGSALSQMTELFAERNPLYGRMTMPLRIEPLPLRDAAQFFPNYTDEDVVGMYGILGGMPYYLKACDPDANPAKNVVDLLLRESGALHEEPQNLLMSELREPASYASILAAVSQGCTTSNEIAQRVGRNDTRALSPYLDKLVELDLIEVSRSLDASPKSRATHVAIKDNLMAFWHRFVLPNLTAIASGHGQQVFDLAVAPRLSGYMGFTYERICIEYMKRHAQEHLGIPSRGVGQIWGKDFDIDVAGELLDGQRFFAECKWQNAPMDIGMLNKLTERAQSTNYGKDRPKQLLMFSRGGFKADLEAFASETGNLHLVPIAGLMRTIEETPAPKAKAVE